MDGVLYKVDNFENFKKMMRLNHSEEFYSKYKFLSEDVDFYNHTKYQIIVKNNLNEERVLIIPRDNNLAKEMGSIKSIIESMTETKLTKVKSNVTKPELGINKNGN